MRFISLDYFGIKVETKSPYTRSGFNKHSPAVLFRDSNKRNIISVFSIDKVVFQVFLWNSLIIVVRYEEK
jgi:hypothetical protein